MWLSPPLCQSVVAEVKYKLVEGVRLDLSHFLFLLFHNLHGGFLQGGAGRCQQLASARHSPVAFRQACESLSSALIPFLLWCVFFLYVYNIPLQPDSFVHDLPKKIKIKWNELVTFHEHRHADEICLVMPWWSVTGTGRVELGVGNELGEVWKPFFSCMHVTANRCKQGRLTGEDEREEYAGVWQRELLHSITSASKLWRREETKTPPERKRERREKERERENNWILKGPWLWPDLIGTLWGWICRICIYLTVAGRQGKVSHLCWPNHTQKKYIFP